MTTLPRGFKFMGYPVVRRAGCCDVLPPMKDEIVVPAGRLEERSD